METFNIIIAGTREFDDYDFLRQEMNKIKKILNTRIKVISGGCRGPDLLGEKWAKEDAYVPIQRFDADWLKYGKKAGPIRNQEMADNADMCIVFVRQIKDKNVTNLIDISLESQILVKQIMVE